jgi:hypothetical protein
MSDSDDDPYLRFRRMPLLLRILVVLLAADGAFRLVRYLMALVAGEPTRISQLGTGVMFLAAGVQLLRGRRRGIDWIVPYNLLLFGMLAYGLWRSGEVPAQAVGLGALLLALTGYLWWCRQRLPWQARGSYGQWMTDPDFRDGAAAWFAERDRIVAQDRRQPPDPDEVVRSLLDGADADMVRHRLQEAPQHFGMAVLRALADPAFRRDPEILAMLIDQLPDELHERARSSLVASLDHLTGFERGQVLRRLAEAGDPSLRERLLRELDGNGGEYVAEGLATAFAEGAPATTCAARSNPHCGRGSSGPRRRRASAWRWHGSTRVGRSSRSTAPWLRWPTNRSATWSPWAKPASRCQPTRCSRSGDGSATNHSGSGAGA